MGILFALVAALSQSVLYVSLKKSYENLAPSIAFFFDMLLSLVIWIPFALIVGVDFSRMGTILVYALISGVLAEAFVFYVFSKGEVSYTGTIFSTYPLFTILFSVLINHERLLPLQWVMVVAIIVGTLIISMPEKINRKELAKKSFILWPLLAALGVGISDTLAKGIIDKTSAESFLFGLAFAQIPIALGYLRYEKQRIPSLAIIKKDWHTYKFSLLGSLMNVITVLFLWLAFSKAPASIASPITASYPGFMVLMAIVFLKERVAKKDYWGFGLIILAVMGISYFSP